MLGHSSASAIRGATPHRARHGTFRRRHGSGRAAPPDFATVAAAALGNARSLLCQWFPMGRLHGRNFRVGGLGGERGESLSISTADGCWIDFAEPASRGGDLVSLLAARLRTSQADAAHAICGELGIDTPLKAGGMVRHAVAPHHRMAGAPVTPIPEPEPPDEAQRRSIGAAARIWRERRPLIGSVAEIYLRTRGLVFFPDEIPADLGFHPRCPRGSGTAPAMLALMRDAITGEAIGVHRTFILPDGSGKDSAGGAAKRMLGRAKGAVIALSPRESVTSEVGATEGIECGLSLLRRGWTPVWACGSANAVAGLPVLGGVERLVLFADTGDAGTDAARTAAMRWADAGRAITVHFPRKGGMDWNDIHRADSRGTAR